MSCFFWIEHNDVRYPDLELFLDWNESGNQSEKLRAGGSTERSGGEVNWELYNRNIFIGILILVIYGKKI